MTLGVDARSNALIVTAPDPLYQEVKVLVTQLDHAAEANRDESMKVVTIKQANPQLIQRAVTAMVGSQVKSSTTAVRPGGGGPMMGGMGGGPPMNNPGGGDFQPGNNQQRDQFQQRMDFFNEIQRQGGMGGGSRGGSSRGGTGGGSTGGSSRSRGGR